MVQHIERARPPGRNDPCPCGSGKKYKRCCLIHEATCLPVRRVEDILSEVISAEQAGDLDAAIELLSQARVTMPALDLDRALAERYLKLEPEEAEHHLREWWDAEHDRSSAFCLAQLLVKQDRKSEALSILAESQGTASPEYWRLCASLRDQEGDLDAAIAAMELYIRLASEDGDAWLGLADMQRRAAQNDRALLSLRRASDVMPDKALPRMLRLQVLGEEGRWREIRDLAETVLEGVYEDWQADMSHDVRDHLARAYFVLGDFEAARGIWKTLLGERPNAREARYQLANLELMARRYRQALCVLAACEEMDREIRVLDIQLRCSLALLEYEEATRIARLIEEEDPLARLIPLVRAVQARDTREYNWALEMLEGEPADRYRDLWNNLRLDCLAHLGRWQEIPATLKVLAHPDDDILTEAALGSLAAGKLDLAERLLNEIEDQQAGSTRSLNALLGPIKQLRRAAEVRRQQQVDEAEKQRRAAESRDLRRRLREVERHNAALAESLARSEAALERLLELVGVTSEGGVPADWDAQLQRIAQRAHKDALVQELQQAEQRLRSMLGDQLWLRLSEKARVSLREGEWLFAAVEGEDRDYGAALLEYARGLERAFKDSIFVPAKALWERVPGSTERLQIEGHDPSLGPFVRYLMIGTHLTLGSMASALDRMGDNRRQGVAIDLLRSQIGIDHRNERALEDWKRTASRLLVAADARNRPAHAAAVSREAVQQFRDLVLGTDGLIRSLSLGRTL
ncbi:MAG TPA: SEC-C metal-binding domain-containing protein [Chloroflexota bacterium]